MEADYEQKHQKGGCPSKLSVQDKLVIMLQYYREYRTMRHIAFDYGVVKSTISDTVAWAEQTLIRSGLFRLPAKRKLLEADSPVEVFIADVAEGEIEHPEKKQKNNYSGKKKRHTLKLQIIADAQIRDVICISTTTERNHDFTLPKDICVHFSKKTEVLADKEYQRIAKLLENSTVPVKGSKKHRLTAEEHKRNVSMSRRRIYIGHINRYIKRFRILSSRYRNKCKKFGLRASLICGIFNFQHTL